jgi:hypothetical protein
MLNTYFQSPDQYRDIIPEIKNKVVAEYNPAEDSSIIDHSYLFHGDNEYSSRDEEAERSDREIYCQRVEIGEDDNDQYSRGYGSSELDFVVEADREDR